MVQGWPDQKKKKKNCKEEVLDLVCLWQWALTAIKGAGGVCVASFQQRLTGQSPEMS